MLLLTRHMLSSETLKLGIWSVSKSLSPERFLSSETILNAFPNIGVDRKIVNLIYKYLNPEIHAITIYDLTESEECISFI